MKKLISFLMGAAGPSLVVALLMLSSALVDPLLSAIWIGMGAASMLSPPMFLGIIITAFAAKAWWHGLFGTSLSYAVHRAFFVKPLDDFDSSLGYEFNSAFGAIALGLIVVGLVALSKMALMRVRKAG